jgi:hypothetical protein
MVCIKIASLFTSFIHVLFISLPNPSSRTMALGSTQPPTEMSTKNIFLEAQGGRPNG